MKEMILTDLNIHKMLEQLCLAKKIRISLDGIGNLPDISCVFEQDKVGTNLCFVHFLPFDLQLAFRSLPFLFSLLSFGSLLNFSDFCWRGFSRSLEGILRENVNSTGRPTLVNSTSSSLMSSSCSLTPSSTYSLSPSAPSLGWQNGKEVVHDFIPDILHTCRETILLGTTSLRTSSSIV